MRNLWLIFTISIFVAGCVTQQGPTGYRLEAIGDNQLRISGIRFELEDPIYAAAIHVFETCGGRQANGLTQIRFTSSMTLPIWTEEKGWRFTNMKCAENLTVSAATRAEVLVQSTGEPVRTMVIGLP